MRSKFSKEEIENWDSLDYQWAIENIQKDEEEKFDMIKNILEFLKPYLNLELYKAEQNKERENKLQNVKDNQIIKEFNTSDTQFSIDSKGGDVFSDTIDFVEDEIPLILEE